MLKYYEMIMSAEGKKSTVWMRIADKEVSYVDAAGQSVELPEVHEMAFVTRKALKAIP